MLLVAPKLSPATVPLSRVLHIAASATSACSIPRKSCVLLILLPITPSLTLLALLSFLIGRIASCCSGSLRDLSPARVRSLSTPVRVWPSSRETLRHHTALMLTKAVLRLGPTFFLLEVLTELLLLRGGLRWVS